MPDRVRLSPELERCVVCDRRVRREPSREEEGVDQESVDRGTRRNRGIEAPADAEEPAGFGMLLKEAIRGPMTAIGLARVHRSKLVV